ncbi:MAG TPA: hypothetical protein V6D25_18295 [Leptolyngbyaceae cyanobacterium]
MAHDEISCLLNNLVIFITSSFDEPDFLCWIIADGVGKSLYKSLIEHEMKLEKIN